MARFPCEGAVPTQIHNEARLVGLLMSRPQPWGLRFSPLVVGSDRDRLVPRPGCAPSAVPAETAKVNKAEEAPVLPDWPGLVAAGPLYNPNCWPLMWTPNMPFHTIIQKRGP